MLALRYALQRNFALHRQWAIRLYLLANGVWFLSVLIYALPVSLLVFEMYLKAQQKTAHSLFQIFTATLILILTGLMSIGIFAATMGMWLPRI